MELKNKENIYCTGRTNDADAPTWMISFRSTAEPAYDIAFTAFRSD